MDKRIFVLDTSAIITYLGDEKGADKVMRIISSSVIPFICLSELYYLVWKKRDKAKADTIYGAVKSWGLPILYPNERVILNAGRLKAVYKLGIADSYVASFCIDIDCKLVTKDLDYKILENELSLFILP